MEPRRPYPTALSNREWTLIQHLVPAAKPGGRPEQYPKREMLDAICYILRRGCAWRLLPHDFPPWQLVYQYCWRWRKDGTWQHLHDMLRGDVRVAARKRRQPSASSIASQSIKTTETGGSAAMMRTSTSRDASGISGSRPWACSWPSSSRLLMCKTAMGREVSWRSCGTSFRGCGLSGLMGPMLDNS
jgi:transposase